MVNKSQINKLYTDIATIVIDKLKLYDIYDINSAQAPAILLLIFYAFLSRTIYRM